MPKAKLETYPAALEPLIHAYKSRLRDGKRRATNSTRIAAAGTLVGSRNCQGEGSAIAPPIPGFYSVQRCNASGLGKPEISPPAVRAVRKYGKLFVRDFDRYPATSPEIAGKAGTVNRLKDVKPHRWVLRWAGAAAE